MTDTLNPFRQAQYLSAMGIQRWVLRNNLFITNFSPPSNISSSPTFANVTQTIEVTALGETPLSVKMTTPPLTIIEEPPTHSLNWEQLKQRVTICTRCELHQQRQQTVFGGGPQNAQWLFIGEAPGEEEEAHGQPFVGVAGQLLNAMLYAIGLTREEVYIVNIVKCRPPDNRNLKVEEIVHCNPFLQRQIVLLKPKLIIALGAVATQHLLNTSKKIGDLRGQRFEYEGIPLIATYHPAYLLRRPIEKRKSWHDLQIIYKTFTDLCQSPTKDGESSSRIEIKHES